jgi:hypothetical protein
MENEKKADEPQVEKVQEEVPAVVVDTPVEKQKEEMVSIPKSQLDTMLATTEEITKIAEKKAKEASDFKRGMDKYKSKLKENDLDDEEPAEVITSENLSEVVGRVVSEQMAKMAPLKVEEDELTKANKKMEEMKRAFINSAQINSSNTNMGSNLDKPEIKTSYFSAEDEAELRQRAARIGVDPDKFIKQVADSASSNAPGAWKTLESKRFNQ